MGDRDPFAVLQDQDVHVFERKGLGTAFRVFDSHISMIADDCRPVVLE